MTAAPTETPSGAAPAAVHELPLLGCSPLPLASYLKALGVLRLVAEQADREARGCWRGDHFVLTSSLDREALRVFFLERYEPTPILAPWNGGSGFYPSYNRSGIEPIESGSAERFRQLRDAIRAIREVLARRGLEEKPGRDEKAALLVELRAELPEPALRWFDAAVLLADQDPKYPPLLGTGGNDGRLDFTNNFLQRLVSLFDASNGRSLPTASSRLDEALFDSAIPGMEVAAVGQFSPGDAGGPNQTAGFEAKSLVNPWDFVFMLEGAVLFSAAATRRLETSWPGAMSSPFTVRATGCGSSSTDIDDEESARSEIWTPLWDRGATLGEIRALLSEGRATVGRRPAVDGLDFLRSISRLGFDRGISSFQRFAFLKRSGKSYFATPLNRVRVRRSPGADFVDELDQAGWLTRFRRSAREAGSNRARSLARRLDDAIFELILKREDPGPQIQRLLAVLGQVQLFLACSPKAREKCPPVPWLSREWPLQADDGSDAFAIAAGLAGLHARRDSSDGDVADPIMPMRAHLAPEEGGWRPTWDEGAGRTVTWSGGHLEDDLVNALRRRLLDARRDGVEDKPLHGWRAASLPAVAAWIEGRLDERRVASLLPGLMLTRIPTGESRISDREFPLPAAYRVLKPFFCTDAQLVRTGILPAEGHLDTPPELVRKMAAKDTAAALAIGVRRLEAKGLNVPYRRLAPGPTPGPRLLAALMVPVSDRDLRRLLPRGMGPEAQHRAAS